MARACSLGVEFAGIIKVLGKLLPLVSRQFHVGLIKLQGADLFALGRLRFLRCRDCVALRADPRVDPAAEATAVGVPLQETGYIQLRHTRQRLSLPASGANEMGFWATGRAAAG